MAELGVIKVGTNAEYPPFELVDENGNVIGFDIDVMNAIAKAAGFEVEFVNTRWDGIFVALASGEFQAVASAATITDERKQAVDFSDPYFNAGQVLVVKNGSDITSVDDLAGKKVGVQLGTTGDIWASENTEAEMKRYDEVTLAFQALGNGDVDAIINDAPTSADILKANPEIGGMIIGEPFTDEFYGIAVNKDRQDVLKAINEGLAAIRASGEYDEIYDKWLGVPVMAEGDGGDAMARGHEAFGLESCDGFTGIVQKMTAVDDMTVEFTLCKPDPAFLSKAAFTAFAIQPSEWIEEHGRDRRVCWRSRSGPVRTRWMRGTVATASSSRSMPTTGASRPCRHAGVPLAVGRRRAAAGAAVGDRGRDRQSEPGRLRDHCGGRQPATAGAAGAERLLPGDDRHL